MNEAEQQEVLLRVSEELGGGRDDLREGGECWVGVVKGAHPGVANLRATVKQARRREGPELEAGIGVTRFQSWRKSLEGMSATHSFYRRAKSEKGALPESYCSEQPSQNWPKSSHSSSSDISTTWQVFPSLFIQRWQREP